jgi:hypothetical protein
MTPQLTRYPIVPYRSGYVLQDLDPETAARLTATASPAIAIS